MSTSIDTSAALDTDALTAPFGSRRLRDALRRIPRDPDVRGASARDVASGVSGLIAWGICWILALLVAAATGLGAAVAVLIPSASSPRYVGPLGVMFLLCALGLVFLTIKVRQHVRILRGSSRRKRLRAFVAANPELSYIPRITDPPWGATLFRVGTGRVATDVVVIDRGRRIVIGNYRFTGVRIQDRVGDGRAFAAIQLPVHLPHLALVARRGRWNSAAPLGFGREQVLSLEGDFDRRFTLYAPRGYERDALYVFAPDLMTRVLDTLGAVDVEIVDDGFVVCFRKPIDMTSPDTYASVLHLSDSLGAKLDRQTSRYRDERSAIPGQVAPAGRRLRVAVPVVAGSLGLALLIARILHWMSDAGMLPH